MDIKPIETVYNGYRFRSRLEARWAVFFQVMKIAFLYEPQGFHLKDGTLYLPDFYLPHFNVYVEIKSCREKDDGKAVEFALSGAEKVPGILICYGDPADHDIRFVTFWESDESGGGCYDTGSGDATFEFHIEDGVAVPHVYIPDSKTERQFFMTKNIFAEYMCPPMAFASGAMVLYAETKARQARFEHGETPTVPTKTSRCPLHEYVFTCEGCKHEHNQQCDFGVKIGWNGDSIIGLYPDYQA